MSGPTVTAPPPAALSRGASGGGGAVPVTPSSAAAAATAAATALTGGGGDPATEKVEKVRRYVTASCGRCHYHLSNWTVRTPARRAPVSTVAEGKEEAGAGAGAGAGGCGSGGGGGTAVGSSAPMPGSSPGGAAPTAAASADGSALGPLLEPDQSDLFPSHLKTTYLGPEHVLLFPNVEGARALLGRAVLLDLQHADGGPAEHDEHEHEDEAGLGAKEGEATNGSVPGHLNRPSDLVTLALLCPRCSFLLASSPTSQQLALNSRFVIYKPSLRLTSTTDVPSPSTEPSSPTQPLGPSDFGSLKPDIHDALPLIYDREEFEEILLRSSLAPSASSRFVRKFSGRSRRASDGYGERDSELQLQKIDSAEEQDSNADFDMGNILQDDQGDEDEDEDIYGTTNPAELVILMVGQFWCPFAVSAAARLSDYRRRQGMVVHDKGRKSGVFGHSMRGRGGGHDGSGSSARGGDHLGLGYRQSITPSASTISNSNHSTSAHGTNDSIDTSKNNSPTPATDVHSRHRRIASVPVPSNVFSGGAAQKPHHKVSKSSLGLESDDNTSNMNNRGATPRSPCTFLLLDSFYHGESGGGVDPSQVLRPALAGDVKELPIPSFLVWYRGCRVNVTNASQHFRCLRGAVIGLDLARYVDIVVPRIGAEAKAAFSRCGVSVPGDNKTVGIGLGDRGDLFAGGKPNKVIWADVGDVPDLDDRPMLDIKL